MNLFTKITDGILHWRQVRCLNILLKRKNGIPRRYPYKWNQILWKPDRPRAGKPK